MRRTFLALLVPLLALPLMADACDPDPACDRTASPSTFASEKAATPNGGTLCLVPGSYGDVTLDRSITIANAMTTKPTLRTLRITASLSRARGLNVTGGGDPLVTVSQTVANVIIENSTIHDGSGNGMRNRGDYVTVRNNDFFHFGSEDAIRLWGDHHSYIGNHIHDVQNSGHNDAFQTYRTSSGDEAVTNLLLDGNTVENFPGSNAHCFMVEDNGQANWTVRNNTFRGIGSHCFILGKPGEDGVTNVQIHDNTFTNIGGTAIECHGGTYGSITGNTFTNVGRTVGHYDNSACTGQ